MPVPLAVAVALPTKEIMSETRIHEAQCLTTAPNEGGGYEIGASIAVDGSFQQAMLVQKCCDDVDCSEGSPAWPGDCSLKFDCGSIFCEEEEGGGGGRRSSCDSVASLYFRDDPRWLRLTPPSPPTSGPAEPVDIHGAPVAFMNADAATVRFDDEDDAENMGAPVRVPSTVGYAVVSHEISL